ncbi:MAG TPA: KGG domain-containing protein [Burkholderiaceae bacterium]|nr:KGG domain-containing protein [Burkholderiaceae bacterium]
MATSNQDNPGSKQGSQGGSKQSDTSKRGFASMDPAQQREIASEGGRAAHEKGTAHEFTSEEARRAGSMSHKNDQGSKQSSTGGSASRSGAGSSQSATREDTERSERSGKLPGGNTKP